MDVETLDIADSVKERTRALLSSCVIKEEYFKRNVFPSTTVFRKTSTLFNEEFCGLLL